MESITNRPDQVQKRLTGFENRLRNYYIQIAIKKKEAIISMTFKTSGTQKRINL
jgi:hypothetical protein